MNHQKNSRIKRVENYEEEELIGEAKKREEEIAAKKEEGETDRKKLRVRIDWESMQIDYIHGIIEKGEDGKKRVKYPTIKELSEKYEVSKRQIDQRCWKHKWVLKKHTFQERMRQERAKDMGVERTLRGSIYEGDTLIRLEKLNDLMDNMMEDMEEAMTNEDEAKRRGVKPQDLVSLSKVLETNLKLAKEIYGVPRDYEQLYKETQEEFEKKASAKRKITGEEVNELLRALREKTIDVKAEEVK